jgi:hypothetical protein
MDDATVNAAGQESQYPLLQSIFTILSKYLWILPVTFGVPGNILTIMVANRKHNRKLSPSVYMTAMAVADTIFLLELSWCYSSFTRGYLDNLTVKSERAAIARFVILPQGYERPVS